MRLHQSGGAAETDDRPMKTNGSPPQRIVSRPEAIARIRGRLKSFCDEEHCACAAAAHRGILCGGLRNLSDKELRRRFDWIARSRPDASREELERLVSLYHVSRQQVSGDDLCCDLETREHCGCDGWNMFDNDTLERFHEDLTGVPISIESRGDNAAPKP
jgi:hypothetical protein